MNPFYSILRIQKISVSELTEARILFEPSIARLACDRFTPEDAIKLEQNIQEASKLVKARVSVHAKFIEFHSLIAESTHNPVIAITIKTLLDAVREITLEIADNSKIQIESASKVLRNHKIILRALREKNSQKVYESMLKDILYIKSRFRAFKSWTE